MSESDAGKQGRKISVKDFLTDFRAGISDANLRDKYRLTAQNFVRLLKELAAKKLVTARDLEKRREQSVQQAKAKELEFLAGLYICPKCGHPATQPFEICPACEIHVDEYLSGQHALTVLSETGTNFYVEEAEDDSITPTESTPYTTAPHTSDREPEPPDFEDFDESQDKPTKKSALDSVRSLFGGKKKK
jgi:hypothetical protein